MEPRTSLGAFSWRVVVVERGAGDAGWAFWVTGVDCGLTSPFLAPTSLRVMVTRGPFSSTGLTSRGGAAKAAFPCGMWTGEGCCIGGGLKGPWLE
jgi:hypothetical protein